MPIITDNLHRGIVFALTTALIGSTAGAATKLIASDVPISVIIFIQYSLCLLLILPRILKDRQQLHTTQITTHITRGLAGWLSFLAYFYALNEISLVEANLLRNTAPLFVPLVVFIWGRQIIEKRRWLPLVVGFIGIGCILSPENQSSHAALAYWIGLGSGAALAASMVGTRRLSRTDSSQTIMFYYFALSTLCSLPLAIKDWQGLPALNTWPYLAYIGVSIYLAMWSYTLAYSYAKPSVVAPISYFSVVFSGLLGWVLWQDMPTTLSFYGILLVVCAGAATLAIPSARPKQTETNK